MLFSTLGLSRFGVSLCLTFLSSPCCCFILLPLLTCPHSCWISLLLSLSLLLCLCHCLSLCLSLCRSLAVSLALSHSLSLGLSLSVDLSHSLYLFLCLSLALFLSRHAGGVEEAGRCRRIKAVCPTAALWESVQRASVARQPQRASRVQTESTSYYLPTLPIMPCSLLPTVPSTCHFFVNTQDWIEIGSPQTSEWDL